MPLKTPNLDDRSFEQLRDGALALIRARSPEWTDLSVHDPGRILLEAFAYMTDGTLYRVNRLPDKVYVALLNLLGVKLQAPQAAVAEVEIIRSSTTTPLTIRAGELTVTAGRLSREDEPPVFALAHDVDFGDGETATATFVHGRQIGWDLIGTGSGVAGLELSLRDRPIVAKRGALDFEIAVESGRERSETSIEINGVHCEVWRETARFEYSERPELVYVVDRTEGVVSFAPDIQRLGLPVQDLPTDSIGIESSAISLGEVPQAGRRIYARYWIGGGANGNVAAGGLDQIKDDPTGVLASVTNPTAASGGRDVESLDNALARAPAELFAGERAVTKGDYEALAKREGGISRARAFTGVSLWPHLPAGSVVVVAVPEGNIDGGAMLDQLMELQQQDDDGDNGDVLKLVQKELEVRQPLGASVQVTWARYKAVQVSASVVLHAAEDVDQVHARLTSKLNDKLTPMPYVDGERPFGKALRVSEVYEILLSEKGVHHVDKVQLRVEEVPHDAISFIGPVRYFKGFWFCGSGANLFRSQNDGDSWERLALDKAMPTGMPFGRVESAAIHPLPQFGGLLAVAVKAGDDSDLYAILVSEDTGESWTHWWTVSDFEAFAWIERGNSPVLLVAERGLTANTWGVDQGARALVVNGQEDRIFRDLSVARLSDGAIVVGAVERLKSGQPNPKVYLAVLSGEVGENVDVSAEGIRNATQDNFHEMPAAPLDNANCLRLQQQHSRLFAWLGCAVGADDSMTTVFRAELTPGDRGQFRSSPWEGFGNPTTWQRAGSTYALAFDGQHVLAATHRGGLMMCTSRDATESWRSYKGNEGLPTNAMGTALEPVRNVAAKASGVIMCGGNQGIYRGHGPDPRFESRSDQVVDTIYLPPTGLVCSGEHALDVTKTGVDG